MEEVFFLEAEAFIFLFFCHGDGGGRDIEAGELDVMGELLLEVEEDAAAAAADFSDGIELEFMFFNHACDLGGFP